jgi:hypothetical protein
MKWVIDKVFRKARRADDEVYSEFDFDSKTTGEFVSYSEKLFRIVIAQLESEWSRHKSSIAAPSCTELCSSPYRSFRRHIMRSSD